MATPVDLTALTSAVDFSSVVSSVLAVGLGLISVYCVIFAVRRILSFVRVDYDDNFDSSDPRNSGSDAEFCLLNDRGVVWNGHGIGRS